MVESRPSHVVQIIPDTVVAMVIKRERKKALCGHHHLFTSSPLRMCGVSFKGRSTEVGGVVIFSESVPEVLVNLPHAY